MARAKPRPHRTSFSQLPLPEYVPSVGLPLIATSAVSQTVSSGRRVLGGVKSSSLRKGVCEETSLHISILKDLISPA